MCYLDLTIIISVTSHKHYAFIVQLIMLCRSYTLFVGYAVLMRHKKAQTAAYEINPNANNNHKFGRHKCQVVKSLRINIFQTATKKVSKEVVLHENKLTLTRKSGTGICSICSLVILIGNLDKVNVPVGNGQSHGIPVASIWSSHLERITFRSIWQKFP